MIKNYRTILLDCDGVILDSNNIKTEAFKETLKKEPKILINQFIEYHKQNQGIDRYRKIEYFFSKIKKVKTNYEEQYLSYLEKYASICRDALLNANYLPGIINFLENIRALPNIQIFIISGSEHEELNYIFKKRNIFNYFDGIYGSPKSKKKIIQNLIEEKKFNYPAIYFGDAKSDMIAALKFKIDFVYVYGYSDWLEGKKICSQKKIKILKDFNTVKSILDYDWQKKDQKS